MAALGRFVVGAVAALVLTGAIAGAWLAWRLGQGPLPLSFLDAHVERALSGAGSDVVAKIERTVLTWPREAGLPEIHVLGVRFARADGTPIGSLPEVSIRPSGRALFRGRFAVSRIGLTGVRLGLARDAKGRVRLGAEEGADDTVAPLLGALLSRTTESRLVTESFRGLRIRDAAIVLDDRPLQTVWRATEADLDLVRRRNGFTGLLRADLSVDGGSDAPLGELVTAIAASFEVELRADGVLSRVDFEIDGSEGRFALAGDDVRALRIRSLEAEGRLSGPPGVLELDRLRLETDAATVESAGRIGGNGERPALDLEVRIAAFAVNDVDRLWPPALAPGARDWVRRNLRDGSARHARLAIRLPGDAAGEAVSEVALTFEVEVEGVTVHALRPMRPLKDVRGSVRVTESRLDARVREGGAGDLRLARATMEADLGDAPLPATIDVEIVGPAADLFALFDQPPLSGWKPAVLRDMAVDGRSETRAEIRFALGGDVDAAGVKVAATARLEETNLSGLPGGIGVANGRFTVDRGGEGDIAIEGSGILREVPGVEDGRAHVVLEIARPDGAGHRAARLDVRREGLAIDTRALLAPDGVERIEVGRLRAGANDLAGEAIRGSDGVWKAFVEGASVDLEPLVHRLRSGENAAPVFGIPFEAGFRFDRATTGDLELRDLGGRVRGDDAGIVVVEALARLEGGGTARLRLAPQEDGRRLELSADDAGRILRTLGIFEDAAGGSLDLEATLAAEDGSHGRVDIRDVRILRAPILARVLGGASLGGASDLLRGEGLLFTRARFPFTWNEGVLTVKGGRAIGSLGVTAEGVIDRRRGRVDVGGDLFPAYTLNSVLGEIPLIGRLVTGKKGEGVFGIRYRVRGEVENPDVQVNPLSALAPGILREMFIDPFSR